MEKEYINSKNRDYYECRRRTGITHIIRSEQEYIERRKQIVIRVRHASAMFLNTSGLCKSRVQ